MAFTLIASENGCVLNSNLDTGGGTNDTTALQALIDSAHATATAENIGTVILDGVALVSSTIILRSYVILSVNANCGMFLAPYSHCHILATEAPLAVDGTIISNFDCGIEFGANARFNCNGLYQHRWEEQNNRGYPPSGIGAYVYGIWIRSVQDFTLNDVVLRNARTFGFVFSNVYGLRGRNLKSLYDLPPAFWYGDPTVDEEDNPLTPHNNNDTLHFWGTCEDIVIDGVYGEGDDDTIALNTTECAYQNVYAGPVGDRVGYSPMFGGVWAAFNTKPNERGTGGGHLKDITIKNLIFSGLPNKTGIRLGDMFNTNPSENYLENIRFENVSGNAGAASFWLSWCPDAAVHSITIDGWSATGYGIDIARADSITLNDIAIGTSVVLGTYGATNGNYFFPGKAYNADGSQARTYNADGSEVQITD